MHKINTTAYRPQPEAANHGNAIDVSELDTPRLLPRDFNERVAATSCKATVQQERRTSKSNATSSWWEGFARKWSVFGVEKVWFERQEGITETAASRQNYTSQPQKTGRQYIPPGVSPQTKEGTRAGLRNLSPASRFPPSWKKDAKPTVSANRETQRAVWSQVAPRLLGPHHGPHRPQRYAL